MDQATKSILESKTFWVNVLTFLFLIVNRKEQILDPAFIEPGVAILLPFVNIWLRYITKSGVHIKG